MTGFEKPIDSERTKTIDILEYILWERMNITYYEYKHVLPMCDIIDTLRNKCIYHGISNANYAIELIEEHLDEYITKHDMYVYNTIAKEKDNESDKTTTENSKKA